MRVTDEEVVQAMHHLARTEQLLVCPEGAATVPALRDLVQRGWVETDVTIVLVNTGSGAKYTDLLTDAALTPVLEDVPTWLEAPGPGRDRSD